LTRTAPLPETERRQRITILCLLLVSSLAANEVKTLDVGRNPERVTRGRGGKPLRSIVPGYRSAGSVETDQAGNLCATEGFPAKIWQIPPVGRAPILLHQAPSMADHFLDPPHPELIVTDSKAGRLVLISR